MEYALRFHTLAAGMKQLYLPTGSLTSAAAAMVSHYDDTIGLENLIQRSIHISQYVVACHQELLTLQYPPELMQVDSFHILSTERQRHIQKSSVPLLWS